MVYDLWCAHEEAYYNDRLEELSIKPAAVDLPNMRRYNYVCAELKPREDSLQSIKGGRCGE